MTCELNDLDITNLSHAEYMYYGFDCIWCGMPIEDDPFKYKPRGCQDCNEEYASEVRKLKKILNHLCMEILNSYTDFWRNSLLDSLSFLEKHGFNCKKPEYSDKRWIEHAEKMKILSIEKGESVYDMHDKLRWLIERYIEIVLFAFKPKDRQKFEKLWVDCWELRVQKNISKNLIAYKVIG